MLIGPRCGGMGVSDMLLGLLLLTLLAFSWGIEAQFSYEDATAAPDYSDDYSATFDYSLFSNGSTEDLEKLLNFPDNENRTLEEDVMGTHKDQDQIHNTAPYSTTLVPRPILLSGLLVVLALNVQNMQLAP